LFRDRIKNTIYVFTKIHLWYTIKIKEDGNMTLADRLFEERQETARNAAVVIHDHVMCSLVSESVEDRVDFLTGYIFGLLDKERKETLATVSEKIAEAMVEASR
jgi:hypothetical protein